MSGRWSSDRANARRIVTVEAARALARGRLPAPVYDYVVGGAGAEITLRQNRLDFERTRFVPRFAATVGTERREVATTVLGTPVSMPVLLGPIGFTRSMHPAGDAAGLAAATAAGTIFCHSSMSGQSLASIADPSPPNYWFQLYFLGGREGAEQLVQRARDAGTTTLVVTVDTPLPGNRERDLVHRVGLPMRVTPKTIRLMAPEVVGRPRWLVHAMRDRFNLRLANAEGLTRAGAPLSEDESLMHWIFEPPTWSDIDWIRANWTGHLVVKGILTGDDARRALDHGADAVIVSNHGGRQLDQSASTLTALTEVVAAVGEATTVMVDGGIRRGSDVAVALCLGARAVLLGRAWALGLAAAGEAGVAKVLDLVRVDLSRTMALLGARTLDELTSDRVCRVDPQSYDSRPASS